MGRKRVEGSSGPTFDSPLLRDIEAAFVRRRKAIRYKVEWEWEREFTETAEGTAERLNLDLRRRAGGEALRLSVWEYGELWVRLCVARPGRNAGWAFQDSFYGSAEDVSAEALVAMVEATIREGFRVGESDPADYRKRLRTIWGRVQPDSE